MTFRWLPLLLVASCDLHFRPMRTDAGPDWPSEAAPDAMLQPNPPLPPGPDTPAPELPPPTCVPARAAAGTGQHNPGRACLSCHRNFTVAGTLVTGAGQPLAGAAISIVDEAGVAHMLVTHQNGNFYSSAAMTFPLRVYASRCPDLATMRGAVNAGGGDCNKSGCHSASGGAGPITLP